MLLKAGVEEVKLFNKDNLFMGYWEQLCLNVKIILLLRAV